MKTLFFLVFLSLCLVNCRNSNSLSSQGQINEAGLDSLFKTNFSDIKDTLNNNNYLTKNERDFVYLVSYLSGIEVSIKSGYIGDIDFNKQKLNVFENWYERNKNRIEWNKMQMGLRIIHSNDYTNENLTELKKLRIK